MYPLQQQLLQQTTIRAFVAFGKINLGVSRIRANFHSGICRIQESVHSGKQPLGNRHSGKCLSEKRPAPEIIILGVIIRAQIRYNNFVRD